MYFRETSEEGALRKKGMERIPQGPQRQESALHVQAVVSISSFAVEKRIVVKVIWGVLQKALNARCGAWAIEKTAEEGLSK